MNKVLKFFLDNKEKRETIVNKDIRVYGWEFEYDYHMTGSLTKYLFEDFELWRRARRWLPRWRPRRPPAVRM